MDWIFSGEKEMSLARPEHKACMACRWWQNTSSLSCCVAEFLSRKKEWVRVPFYAANHVALFEETNQDGSLALSAMYILRISEATRPDTD